MKFLATRRRSIAQININISHPSLSAQEKSQLIKRHFQSLGVGLIEIAIGWWGSNKFISSLGEIHGIENLDAAIAANKGVILLSAHFTTLEISGHILGLKRPLTVLYRRHEDTIIENLFRSGRQRHAKKTIHRDDIKSMVRALKNNEIVWFAFDQNYGHKGSVFSDFFGIPAATNTATSRLAKITGCKVVPFFGCRTSSGKYAIVIQPALKDFPSGNTQQDTDRLNGIIESAVKKCPEQYLWIHRRYKDQPTGGNRY